MENKIKDPMSELNFEALNYETNQWEPISHYRYNACFLGAWGKYWKARRIKDKNN